MTSESPSRTASAEPATGHLPLRSRLAIVAGRTVAGASKLANLGSGSVIGGRVSLALDHNLLATLADGRDIALVSATNGKTTTTHLLATALSTQGPVVSNSLGANMPPGIVAALGESGGAATAVLEVDERWLPSVMADIGPATVLLLNLSRDQLDRSHEVRRIAEDWHRALASIPVVRVVANADDPLIVWAASAASTVEWVATASHWTADAGGCPACRGRIEFLPAGVPRTGIGTGTDPGGSPTGDAWRCRQCGFAKPDPKWSLVGGADEGYSVTRRDGLTIPLHLALPGRVNAANAAAVIAAAAAMGADPELVVMALNTVTDVAGRYRVARIAGADLRMLLAKNPAGWQEAIDMLGPAPRPVVAAINARIADGRDPSWLWDVPFERLRGRFVVALGERRHDLAVRLRYAEVDHTVAETLTDAVREAHRHAERPDADDPDSAPQVDLIANYTAFQDYLIEVDDAR
jgi:UDP-N-acetylmuramyl tripeptide synthase